MMAIPRYRAHPGSALLSAGFRPFFLAASIWAALAIPLWLAVFAGQAEVPSALSSPIWHAHEMVFGFATAAVAGFLLTAIPNWTGRMPLQGGPLAGLVLLWAIGRIGVLLSGNIGAPLGRWPICRFRRRFSGRCTRNSCRQELAQPADVSSAVASSD
jgi:uncharacterized protein involved in response to NO